MRMRPISSTSRKPRVVMRPVRAPVRCRMVLEPTVVPCSTSVTRSGASAKSLRSAARPATTARLGSCGVVATLLSCSTPALESTTMSVNVPPMSTATRTLKALCPLRPRLLLMLLAIEPALGETEQALRHEDHHGDEDDTHGHQIREFREVGKIEGGREIGEQTGQTLAQAQKKCGANDRADQRADAAHHVEDHHLAGDHEVDEVGRGKAVLQGIEHAGKARK